MTDMIAEAKAIKVGKSVMLLKQMTWAMIVLLEDELCVPECIFWLVSDYSIISSSPFQGQSDQIFTHYLKSVQDKIFVDWVDAHLICYKKLFDVTQYLKKIFFKYFLKWFKLNNFLLQTYI